MACFVYFLDLLYFLYFLLLEPVQFTPSRDHNSRVANHFIHIAIHLARGCISH